MLFSNPIEVLPDTTLKGMKANHSCIRTHHGHLLSVTFCLCPHVIMGYATKYFLDTTYTRTTQTRNLLCCNVIKKKMKWKIRRGWGGCDMVLTYSTCKFVITG